MNKIRCGIVGATGYAGAEIVRILLSHPCAEVAAVSSVSYEGMKLSDIWPALYGICDMTLVSGEDIVGGGIRCDVVFAALPAGVSEEMAANRSAVMWQLFSLPKKRTIRAAKPFSSLSPSAKPNLWL